MKSYSQHIHTITHRYEYTVKFKSGKKAMTANGMIEHTSADNVILELLKLYPNSTGRVSKIKK